MKRLLLSISVIPTFFVSVCNASTVGFGPIPTARTVRNSSSNALNDTNSLVWIGAFANQSFTINSAASLSSNVASVMASGGWNQFGLDSVSGTPNDGIISSLGISASGKIGGSVQDNSFGATKADFFNSKGIYVWIFNAPTVNAATEMGIYRASGATPPWTFPTNAGGVGDAVTYSTTSSSAPTIAAIGGFGSTTSSAFQLTNNFSVVPVPEPSSMLIGVFTCISAVNLRRRRKVI